MSERSDDWEHRARGSPSAPEEWVARAIEVPLLERALELLGDSEGDREMRAALEAAGLEPDERRLRALSRLRELSAPE